MKMEVNLFYDRFLYFGNGILYQEIKYLEKPSNNLKYVTVKQSKNCHNCNKKIKQSSRCLTVNKYKKQRVWYCVSCGWYLLPQEGSFEVGELRDGEIIAVETHNSIYKPKSYFNFEDEEYYEDLIIKRIDYFMNEF